MALSLIFSSQLQKPHPLSRVLATSSFPVPIVLRDCFLSSGANRDRTLAVTSICFASIQKLCAHPPLHLGVVVIIYSDKSLRCVLAGWWQGRRQGLVNMPAWRRTICLAVGCWRLACGCSSFLMPGCSRCSGPAGVSRALDCPHPSARPARPEIGVIYYAVQRLMAALDKENAG